MSLDLYFELGPFFNHNLNISFEDLSKIGHHCMIYININGKKYTIKNKKDTRWSIIYVLENKLKIIVSVIYDNNKKPLGNIYFENLSNKMLKMKNIVFE